MFYTYILYSEKLDSYYTGSTSNIEDRILRHNSGRSIYTKRGIPWKLVYFKIYNSKSEAFKAEMYIKSQKSRLYIEQLIGGFDV
jgi:putative endonuclease